MLSGCARKRTSTLCLPRVNLGGTAYVFSKNTPGLSRFKLCVAITRPSISMSKVRLPVSPPRQAQGSCQDYSNIMITLARSLRVPCRYVSGYLFHRVEYNDRSAQDAARAWVEAPLPGLGRVGVQIKPAEEPDSEEALRLIAALSQPAEAEHAAQQQQQ